MRSLGRELTRTEPCLGSSGIGVPGTERQDSHVENKSVTRLPEVGHRQGLGFEYGLKNWSKPEIPCHSTELPVQVCRHTPSRLRMAALAVEQQPQKHPSAPQRGPGPVHDGVAHQGNVVNITRALAHVRQGGKMSTMYLLLIEKKMKTQDNMNRFI